MTTVVERAWIKCDKCGEEVPELPPGKKRYFVLRSMIEEDSSALGRGCKKGWEVGDLCNRCEKKLKTWLIGEGYMLTEINEGSE